MCRRSVVGRNNDSTLVEKGRLCGRCGSERERRMEKDGEGGSGGSEWE
jgi:hypothetical protein